MHNWSLTPSDKQAFVVSTYILYIYIYIYIYIYTHIHTHTLTGHFFRHTLLVPGWTLFCLQNCLNSSCHRFNEVLETFLRDFGPYLHDSIGYLSAAHPWYESPVPPHPKDALLDLDLVTVEAIWVKWNHCHVQETSLRWFELCDMVHYPAGSRHQKMGTL